jgi:hypothetical protein
MKVHDAKVSPCNENGKLEVEEGRKSKNASLFMLHHTITDIEIVASNYLGQLRTLGVQFILNKSMLNVQ